MYVVKDPDQDISDASLCALLSHAQESVKNSNVDSFPLLIHSSKIIDHAIWDGEVDTHINIIGESANMQLFLTNVHNCVSSSWLVVHT